MIALAFAIPAFAGGWVSLGTGMGPLDLPGASLVGGGGVRLGGEVGPVAPFVGGHVSRGDVGVSEGDDDEITLTGTSWSAQAGARVHLGGDELARPYVAGGALLFGLGAGVRERYGDRRSRSDALVRPGPGGFAGFGADARLARALDLGVEVGGVYAAPRIGSRYVDDHREDESFQAMQAAWLYADLHLTFRWGAR